MLTNYDFSPSESNRNWLAESQLNDKEEGVKFRYRSCVSFNFWIRVVQHLLNRYFTLQNSNSIIRLLCNRTNSYLRYSVLIDWLYKYNRRSCHFCSFVFLKLEKEECYYVEVSGLHNTNRGLLKQFAYGLNAFYLFRI